MIASTKETEKSKMTRFQTDIQTLINKMAARKGSKIDPNIDPRHVDGFINLAGLSQNSITDNEIRKEIRNVNECINTDLKLLESNAVSYGL